MSKNNRCPKCGEKLSPFYMKQNCPKCNVNLLYYKMDERLEQDAINAQRETDAVKRFLNLLKDSTISSPWRIIRLVLFFTPLASMCLPMYWAGHKNVSLITFIMNIVNHGFDITSWSYDYLCAMLSIVSVVVVSLAVIINSCFSASKKGFRRDILFSTVNTAAFGAFAIGAASNGAQLKIGFYITMLIYILELVMHYVVSDKGDKTKRRDMALAIMLCLIYMSSGVKISVGNEPADSYKFEAHYNSDISVVSFNVASAFGTSFEDTDSMDRCHRFIDYMQAVEPSLIGTQEFNQLWLDTVSDELKDYTVYGVIRGGDSEVNNSEMNAIMWRNDAFNEVERNTIWLSQTPDEESKYSFVDAEGETVEAACNRICTYAVLDSEQGIVLFLNTHLDNSCEEARSFGAQVILDKIAELKAQYGEDANVVLTGDFNEYIADDACQSIACVLNDCTYQQIAKSTYQEWGYADSNTEPIDFIFTSGKSLEYRVLDDLSRGYVSDHYGIYASLDL